MSLALLFADSRFRYLENVRYATAIVLYPLSFVSEHSETLVELDIEYRHLAEQAGVPRYIRVPTVGTHPQFIHGLANLVQAALWSTKS